MKTERELFEIEARGYEDCDLSRNGDGSYKNDLTHTCFYWWCKSASREGYKLVPVEPTSDTLDKMWEALKGNAECMSCIKDSYKAVINSI